MNSQKTLATTRRYLTGLATNWAVVCLSLLVPLILTPFISKQWLPIIVIGEVLFLTSYLRGNRFRAKPLCMRSVYLATSILILTALVMLTFNILHINWIFGDLIEDTMLQNYGYFHGLPFITILIIAPIMSIVSLWSIISGRRSSFCLECRSQYAFASDDGFVGRLLRSESAYQVRCIFYLGTFLSAIEWSYFLFFFINVNLNTPDKFVFTIVPCALLVLSIIYGIHRSMSLWTMFASNTLQSNADGTTLRYLIISEGEMLLAPDEKTGLLDTPTSMFLAHTPKVSEMEARRRFECLTGLKDFNMRYVYRSSSCEDAGNVLHYMVFVKKRSDVERAGLEGKWCNAVHLNTLINNHQVSPQFAGAYRRIYTIAMAWKTYDGMGRRLYPIKHYRPTFRLNDMEEWDVNYDDGRWLNIACNNEDKLMYKARALWRRYVRCIGC